MDGKSNYDIEKQGPSPMGNSWDDPGFEMLLSPVDTALFGKISDFMIGLADIEDIKSDTAYSITNDEVTVMISDYQKNGVRNKDIEKFIRDCFAEEATEEKLDIEVSKIKDEISRNNLNDISSEWVKEWHEKRQKNNNKDAKTEEIKNFVTKSLKQEEISADLRSDNRKKKGFSKSLITRYASLAAAAIVGVVFLVRSLLLADDPQKIFNKYYEPFNAVSYITRSTVTGESGSFSNAIGSYESGDYQTAAAGFSEAMLTGTLSFPAGFFLGISEIELENYNKAIELLSGVIKQKSEFTKEATWYLGLVYLKSGNKVKASECFELLTRSPGFYSARSEKILRLLR
jgi:TolA-binding protein